MVRIHPDPPQDRSTRTGAVAQLGERLLCKQEVVGSIPSSSTSHSDRLHEQQLLQQLRSSLQSAVSESCSRSLTIRKVRVYELDESSYAIGLSCIFTRLGALETKGG